MSPLSFPSFEIHASHACNLTCESCSHFSNSGHRGVVSVAAIEAWLQPWQHRLAPHLIRFLGGEPSLNPELGQLLLLAKKYFPNTHVALTTNGFFLHKHPELPAIIKQIGGSMHWTVHDDSPAYNAKAVEIARLLAGWSADFQIPITSENSWERWTRRHKGAGAGVMPFQDGNPRASWENCICKTCRQLFEGRLWKCAPAAYLQLQKRTHALDAAWDAYLKYEGLQASCSDAELLAFFEREDEAICGMCPIQAAPFRKPSPLPPRA